MSFPQFARVLFAAIGLAIIAMLWLSLAGSVKGAEKPAAPGMPADALGMARAVVLSPHEGSAPLDEQIRVAQRRAASSETPEVAFERLGRLFIAKARLASDPGFYKLAEQCAASIEARRPGDPEALLLRGHCLAAMHRFAEAEKIAQKLVATRAQVLDFALLGDALMEQGRVDEAVPAYQRMADLKPCLQAYTRIGHLRWLKGDLEGACEMMEQAIQTGTSRDAEPVAWATARLALYRLQAGENAVAKRLAERAIELVPDYAPALLARGRILLAEKDAAGAVASLRTAAERSPLPEYHWTLADALRAAGDDKGAVEIERGIGARGAIDDPRTAALFLATRRTDALRALELAKRELDDRRDIFTHDAVAWALLAAGLVDEARASMALALREGTQDARLFLHAGMIAAAAGQQEEARGHLQAAVALRQMLLPSEAKLLDAQLVVPPRTVAGQPEKHSSITPNP